MHPYNNGTINFMGNQISKRTKLRMKNKWINTNIQAMTEKINDI